MAELFDTFAICHRCGTSIKNTYEYQGNVYGCECIKAVTGQPVDWWIVRNGVIDIEATEAREARKRLIIAENESREIELQQLRKRTAERDWWLISFLEPRQSFNGGFISSILYDLRKGFGVTSMSDRQKDILCDIWARCSGRRNSKAYNAAECEFWRNLENPPAKPIPATPRGKL